MKVLIACEESQAVYVDRRCMNCKWYYEEVCCNGDSEHRADFRLEEIYRRSEEWEKNDGDK